MILNRFLEAVGKIDIAALKGEHAIEISIGAGFFAADSGKSVKALYKEVDTAVYQSKKAEGSCVTYYSSGSTPDNAQE